MTTTIIALLVFLSNKRKPAQQLLILESRGRVGLIYNNVGTPLCLSFLDLKFSASGYQGDNLRSRVNVLANKFLGKKHFPKRAAHDRSKEKRRGKRANKNHIEADSSALQISTNLNTSFLSKVGAKISEDTRAACTLLLNALPGVCDGDPCINREAAALLQSKLAAVDTDQTPFVEALFMIGASSELTAVIDKAMLNFYEKGQGSDQPIISSDGEGSSDPQGKRFDSMEIKENSHSVARSEHVQDDHRPDNIVRDLDAATDILNDLAAGISNSYVTPYSDQSQPDGRRAATTTRREEISKDKKANRSISGAVPGRSQVDELLKLAAGGSDSDEEDRNNTARCPDDCSINNQASQAAILQLDGDVTATVDRIAKEMMEDINGNSPPRAGDQDRSTFGTWQTDRYGSDIAKKKAAALKRLITRTGVPINTIIPAARSQATSRLYAHLSSRAMRFPTSGSGIDPRHASIYGNTAQMTQRMLAQPGAPIQLSHKIPIIPSWNGKSQQYRGRNAEEAKKIEEFGYPPRPSVILGRKRKFR